MFVLHIRRPYDALQHLKGNFISLIALCVIYMYEVRVHTISTTELLTLWQP